MQEFDDILSETRLIAILRNVEESQIEPVLDALLSGGVRLAEITFDATGAQKDEETAGIIANAVRYMSDKMRVGAGTVLTSKQVALTAKAGGEFIISPNMDAKVILKAKALNLWSIPAAMTVSEIVEAHRTGADYIKVFPANAIGGASFFKAVRGPLPNIKLIAVSGVTQENVTDYLNAGAYGFGIGSGIVNAKLCAVKDYKQIEENAHRYANACAGR